MPQVSLYETLGKIYMEATNDPSARTLKTRDAARILGLTPAGVSYAVRAGLLAAGRRETGEYTFSLADVAARLQSKRAGSA